MINDGQRVFHHQKHIQINQFKKQKSMTRKQLGQMFGHVGSRQSFSNQFLFEKFIRGVNSRLKKARNFF